MLKSFGKDLIIYGISSSITKFVGFFLLPLYTRIFSPEEYGSMDIILTIFTFACIISMMQLESAVSRYYYTAKDENAKSILISTVMWAIIIASVLIIIILIVFSTLISSILFQSPKYAIVIIVAALIIPSANLNSLFSVVIRFRKKPLHFLLFQVVQISITVLLTIYLILKIKIGIIGVFFGMLAGFSVSALLMFTYLRSQLRLKFNVIDFKKMTRYSLPLVPAVAGGWANSYVNRFIMLGYLSLTEVGIYAVGLKVASIFQLIGAGFRMAWPPFFMDTLENNKNHREVFVNLQQQISVIVLFCVILITLFSKEILEVVTIEAYFSAAEIVGILSLSLALSSIIMPLTGIGPSITKKTEYNTLIYFLSVVVNISSLFILVPLFGLLGVAISLLLGSLSLVLLGWYNSEKLYPVGFNKIPMFLSISLTLLIIFLQYYFDFHVIVKIVIALVFLVIFPFKYYKTMKVLFGDKRKEIEQ